MKFKDVFNKIGEQYSVYDLDEEIITMRLIQSCNVLVAEIPDSDIRESIENFLEQKLKELGDKEILEMIE